MNIDCVPPSTEASAPSVTRVMLLSGSSRVSEWPPHTLPKRNISDSGRRAPKRSRIARAQSRRIARYLATSSKTSVYV